MRRLKSGIPDLNLNSEVADDGRADEAAPECARPRAQQLGYLQAVEYFPIACPVPGCCGRDGRTPTIGVRPSSGAATWLSSSRGIFPNRLSIPGCCGRDGRTPTIFTPATGCSMRESRHSLPRTVPGEGNAAQDGGPGPGHREGQRIQFRKTVHVGTRIAARSSW